jgi:hypothetical protein
MVSLSTRHTTGRVTAVTLVVAEALAALALRRPFRGRVGLHRHSKPAELGDGANLRHLGTASYRHYKVRRHWAVLFRVPVTAPRAKLHYPLGTDAKGPQLLSDDVLRHAMTQVLDEKSGAAVIWE